LLGSDLTRFFYLSVAGPLNIPKTEDTANCTAGYKSAFVEKLLFIFFFFFLHFFFCSSALDFGGPFRLKKKQIAVLVLFFCVSGATK